MGCAGSKVAGKSLLEKAEENARDMYLARKAAKLNLSVDVMNFKENCDLLMTSRLQLFSIEHIFDNI